MVEHEVLVTFNAFSSRTFVSVRRSGVKDLTRSLRGAGDVLADEAVLGQHHRAASVRDCFGDVLREPW
jgi:hypothetical protein